MCLDAGTATNSAEIVYQQQKFIAEQAKDNTPMQHVKIRCGCLKMVKWSYMHRCLYCSVFFCKECAEAHFGQTIEEYRAENPNDT